jgi:hypothetical protein
MKNLLFFDQTILPERQSRRFSLISGLIKPDFRSLPEDQPGETSFKKNFLQNGFFIYWQLKILSKN